MIRGSWQALISELRSQGKAVLPSFLEIATPAAYDGETLELVFPPDRKFGVSKVEQREDELREALTALFGIAPRIRCVVRESVAGGADVEEDPPLSEASRALRGQNLPERLSRHGHQFGSNGLRSRRERHAERSRSDKEQHQSTFDPSSHESTPYS